jgi:hypothetical protein
VTSTITQFEATRAPCGQTKDGERAITEDRQGLIIEHTSYACGCRSTKEEFHDGSVYHLVVHHSGKVLVEEELRGE